MSFASNSHSCDGAHVKTYEDRAIDSRSASRVFSRSSARSRTHRIHARLMDGAYVNALCATSSASLRRSCIIVAKTSITSLARGATASPRCSHMRENALALARQTRASSDSHTSCIFTHRIIPFTAYSATDRHPSPIVFRACASLTSRNRAAAYSSDSSSHANIAHSKSASASRMVNVPASTRAMNIFDTADATARRTSRFSSTLRRTIDSPNASCARESTRERTTRVTNAPHASTAARRTSRRLCPAQFDRTLQYARSHARANSIVSPVSRLTIRAPNIVVPASNAPTTASASSSRVNASIIATASVNSRVDAVPTGPARENASATVRRAVSSRSSRALARKTSKNNSRDRRRRFSARARLRRSSSFSSVSSSVIASVVFFFRRLSSSAASSAVAGAVLVVANAVPTNSTHALLVSADA